MSRRRQRYRNQRQSMNVSAHLKTSLTQILEEGEGPLRLHILKSMHGACRTAWIRHQTSNPMWVSDLAAKLILSPSARTHPALWVTDFHLVAGLFWKVSLVTTLVGNEMA